MSRFLRILEDYRSILEQESEGFPLDSSESMQEVSPQTQVSDNTDSEIDVISKFDLVNFLNSFKAFIEKLNLPDQGSSVSILDGANEENALEKFKQITDEINPSSISSNSPELSPAKTSQD